MKKRVGRNSLPWGKCFIVIVAVVFILLSAVNVVQFVRLNEWKNKIESMESYVADLEVQAANSSDSPAGLSHYYDLLDEKADAAIDKVVAIVGVLMPVVTIFGGLIAFKAPNDMENKLKEMEDKLAESSLLIERAENALVRMQSDIMKTPSLKIGFLTAHIQAYNGKEEALDEIYFTRGRVYHDMGKYSEAESDFLYAKKLGYDESECFHMLGSLYLERLEKETDANTRKKLYRQAEKYYQKALDKASDIIYETFLYCNFAHLYFSYGEYDKALTYCDKSIKADNKNYFAYFYKAVTLEEKGEEHFKEALSAYTQAIEINPEDTDAHKNRFALAKKILEENPNDMEAQQCLDEDNAFFGR